MPRSTSGESTANLLPLETLAEVQIDDRWRSLSAYNKRPEDAREEDALPPDGLRTLWHPNGVKQGEGLFQNGKKQGRWTWWYESGQKRWEGTYVDDAPRGPERSWYDNGQVEYVGIFLEERRNGSYQRWYDNGQPAVEGTYSDGQREGEFRYWSYDGALDVERSGIYERDVKVGELPG